MKITEIRSLSHKPGLYRVSVDDKPVGYVRADDISELKLVPGQAIRDDTYQELIARVKYATYYNDALHYVDRRLRSKDEVKQFLLGKGCDAELANEIIERLAKRGLVDEGRLAAALIHDALIAKPMSRKALEQKLRQKKLSTESVSSQLEMADYDEHAALDSLIAKKSGLSAYRGNQPKLFRYLLSQGFSFEDIASRIGRPDVSGRSKWSSGRRGL